MSYKSSDILYFREYTFTDTGEVARHYGLAIVPPKLTAFKESILCAVITSKAPDKLPFTIYKFDSVNYSCFSTDSYVRLKDLDYVPEHGLDKSRSQPVGKLTPDDVAEVFKRLKVVLFSPQSNFDKFLRGSIVREWKRIKSTQR